MLTKAQIEQRTLAVAQRAERGEPVEDHLTELKSIWPTDFAKVARQIAGHANSACPEEILWIIGLDEAQVLGAPPNEFSNWWAQVVKCFDGLAPHCRELIVPHGDATLVALLFETDRAPFVVKNPLYGEPNSGPIKREVPWRNSQSTQTATRAQLIQILADPPCRYPDVEIVSASLTLGQEPQAQMNSQDSNIW